MQFEEREKFWATSRIFQGNIPRSGANVNNFFFQGGIL